MPEIVFPPSTAPSVNLTENGGRVINAYAEKAPDGSRSQYLFRKAPGLVEAFIAGEDEPRGALLVGSVLYVINGDKAYTVTKAGTTYTVTELGGSVGGSGPVFMSHNMRSPTPQILIVHSGGMTEIASGTASDFTDADLPATNSITFMDSYFIVTTADGRAFASDNNDTEFNELNFARAEASTDGLVRGVSFGRDLLLMGTTTTEFWGNTGNPTGFPFSRGPVVPIGLAGPYAVAGYEPGFPAPLIWVGSDKAVYRLEGYSPQRISTPYLDRIIEKVNPLTLRASVFVASGHACWVLSSDEWTFVYDLTTGEWHERKSYQQARWRGAFGVLAFNEWLTFDRNSGQVFRIDANAKREGLNPLVFELHSTQMHRFPGRMVVNQAHFDFVTGVGIDRGISPIETNPVASISWSDDGGRTFGNALLRELGTQGERREIKLFRCGLTGPKGRQWKIQVSDPVEVSFMGGSMFFDERAP